MIHVTAQQMVDHVCQLARDNRVVLKWVKPNIASPSAVMVGRAMARLGHRRRIEIVEVTDEHSYAGALHELGHCIHPRGMLFDEYSPLFKFMGLPSGPRDLELQLEAERNAWQWAKANALDWTPTMDQFAAMMYSTYCRKARKYGVTP